VSAEPAEKRNSADAETTAIRLAAPQNGPSDDYVHRQWTVLVGLRFVFIMAGRMLAGAGRWGLNFHRFTKTVPGGQVPM